jgi:hypothetical protein
MDRRTLALAAATALFGGGLLVQSYRVSVLSKELSAERAKPFWPDRPEPPGLEESSNPKFTPTIQTTIPQVFWGEFAEDVHDCGSDRSTIVTERKIMVTEDDRQEIQSVEWKAPQRLVVSALERGFINTSYSMELSEDANEITFVHTNIKRIFQRCSTRAHGMPETLVAEEPNMDVDANMTMNIDVPMDDE